MYNFSFTDLEYIINCGRRRLVDWKYGGDTCLVTVDAFPARLLPLVVAFDGSREYRVEVHLVYLLSEH